MKKTLNLHKFLFDMLNRRILRVKAFKVLYQCRENQSLTLKDALTLLEDSCQATRDLYLYMTGLIPALTAEAAKRTEAARGKFNPTEEDLNPNLKFVRNGISAILEASPDFNRIMEKKKFSWEQNDSFISTLYQTLRTREYFRDYLSADKVSLQADASLWKNIFANELEDSQELAAILEDASIYWADDLGYVLGTVIKSLDAMAREGRWTLPPLYQSEVKAAAGKEVESDSEFVRTLLSVAYGRFEEYEALISASVSKWEVERLCLADVILVSLGLAEAQAFPQIPLKVSMNEYVEIAKYYSTPRSGAFVNGLLDRLTKQLTEEGKIVKQGKGLI